MRRPLASLILASLTTVFGSAAEAQPVAPGAEVVPVQYSSLAGWPEDDHAAALAVFRKGCAPIVAETGALAPPGLQAACRDALGRGELDRDAAHAFIEARFAPFEIRPPATGRGFLTGYYEPEIEGSLVRDDKFAAPLLSRPDDLVTLGPDEAIPGLPVGAVAARRTSAGLEPYPERGAIEDGAIDGHAVPLVFLRDAVAVFIVQVQGSARIRLPDGRIVRVAYAGRNGLPYTSVARLLVEKLGIAPAEMTASLLTEWLRSHPSEARDLLRRNRSYVFFRIADELDPADGPLGAAGIPLTAERSLAVDRGIWSYGLPVWLEADLPGPDGTPTPLRRLVVAQDTGTAIVGPARGDLFFGSGDEAGRRAGPVRQPARFVVLWPKPEPGPASTP